nr:proline-serine-threonine phosphatase-interacting protein 2-like [Lytechinus pictus]
MSQLIPFPFLCRSVSSAEDADFDIFDRVIREVEVVGYWKVLFVFGDGAFVVIESGAKFCAGFTNVIDPRAFVTQAKKTYENRKRELDIADENYMKQRLVLAPKEVDKLTVKKEKCLAAVEQADAQYHASVKTLDDARNDWEKQMEETCIILQAMEEERIKFLRNSMWVHTNMLSLHCVEDDQHCEESRKILEQCSEENDIRLFVAQKRTGSSRPAPIEVEGNWNIAKSTMSNGKTMPSPTSDANRRRDPHTALPSIPSNTPNPLINGARRSLPRQPENEHFQALQHTLRSSDPLYAAVESPPQSNQASKYVRVRYDYKAQESECNGKSSKSTMTLNRRTFMKRQK